MEEPLAKSLSGRLFRKIPFAGFQRGRIRRALLYLQFARDFRAFRSESSSRRFAMDWRERFPCLDDKTSTTPFDRHYVYHTAWAARVLARTRPGEHVDIASYVYFASLASAFIPMRFYDYRPPQLHLHGLHVDRADLLRLPFPDASIPSLSCMHVVEHVGLGRYGDPIDPEGDLRAISELKRVLAPSGDLLFVVPVGRPKIRFNAHRIYSYDCVLDSFGGCDLVEFALVPDDPSRGGLVLQATKEMADEQSYGCGCFWIRKRPFAPP